MQLQFERENPERAKNELAVAVFCPVAPLEAGHAEKAVEHVHQRAGYVTAPDHCSKSKSSCQGAVHT